MSVLEEGLRNIDAAPGFQCSYISTGNSTVTPLSGGATFTGEAEKTAHTDMLVYCYSDVAGTLYIDLGVVKDNYRTSIPFKCSAGASEFHTVVKGYRWCRVRYINDAGAQSVFELQTEFGVYRQANSPINGVISADADAITTRSTQSKHDVALGLRTGATLWHKFGYNSDVDTTTDPEVVASFGGTFVPRTTGTTLSIVSTDANDADSDTGAHGIVIYGVDGDWVSATEVVMLTGTTPVVTTSEWIGINRIAIFRAGSSLTNEGTITVTAVTGSATMAQMPAGNGTSQQVIFHVPDNTQALIDHVYAYVIRFGSGTEPLVTLRIKVFSAVSNANYTVATYYIDAALSNNATINPEQPLVVSEKSTVWMEAETTRDDTQVSGRIVLTTYRDPNT